MENLNIDVRIFSQYIINFINETNRFNANSDVKKEISHLKLQKILYFVYAYAITKWDKKLWKDVFKNWELGPVIPKIYHEYSKFGNSLIALKNNNIALDMLTNFEKLELQALMLELNNNFDAIELSRISHSFPWENTKRNSKLKDSDIVKYFSKSDTFINEVINSSSLESNFKFLT